MADGLGNQFGRLGLVNNKVRHGGAAYVGPLDLFGSAAGAYGTRALRASFIGQPIVAVVDLTTHASQDFIALPDGSLDRASIVTFLGGHAGRYLTLYDQSGHGNHLLSGGENNAADFQNDTNGLAFPNDSPTYITTVTPNLTQPFASSAVYYQHSSNSFLYLNEAFSVQYFFHNANGFVFITADGGSETRNTQVSFDTWYAGQALFNGASSKLLINGASASLVGNVGAGGMADKLRLAAWNSANSGICYIREVILWNSDPGDILRTSIQNNQTAFWGFSIAAAALLLENGSYLLLENGSRLLLG